MEKNILREDIEYAIHCEKDGIIIGPLSKTHAHLQGVRPTLTHYSTWAMIYNPSLKKYGLQLKTPKKHDNFKTPKWDMGVAGHNYYKKEGNIFRPVLFEENLVKETDEEIGLKLEPFTKLKDFLGVARNLTGTIGFIFETFLYQNEINSEWVGAGFILTNETKLEFKDNEVIKFRWLTPEELEDYLKKENNYYAALPVIFEKAEKFRKKYLNDL
ncbi:NUDIX domain-containing protein [Nanoarchaeota archaeon]